MSDYFDRKSAQWDQQNYRVERAQTVAASIRSKVPLSKTMNALDFGCGTGLLGFNLLDAVGQMTFGDTSQGMLDQVAKKMAERGGHALTLLLGDQHPLPAYDLIVSLMVLHHIADIEDQLAVLSRSLVPGGSLCLCDLDKEDGSFHQEEVVPHQGFERGQIESILRKNGLQIVDTSTVFVNRKTIGDRLREFPVFMVIGRKPRENRPRRTAAGAVD